MFGSTKSMSAVEARSRKNADNRESDMPKLSYRRLARAIPVAGSLLGALVLAVIGPAAAFAANVTVPDAGLNLVLPSDGSVYAVQSGSTFDQVDVSGGTFTFTMTAGESVIITAPDNRTLTNNGGFNYNCGPQTTLTISASSSIVVTVTPGGNGFCSFSAGAGGTAVLPIQTATTSMATTTPVVTMATTTPAAAATTSPSIATSPSALSEGQIQAILSLLASFGADQSVVGKVTASLQGTVTAGSITPGAKNPFTRNLKVGAVGEDVKALQAFLNAHGYPVAVRGQGSSGEETTRFGPLTKAALRRFQKAHGITPASGYFGPKTRAYLASRGQ